MLDTTFLIDLQRGSDRAARVLGDLPSGTPLRIPAAVWAEYLSRLPPTKRQRAAEELERTALLVPFDRELADEAARLQHELRREGATLAWADLQVAATALHYDEPLISGDAAFARVPRLDVKPH